jgi:hypothetical protein
VTTCAGLPHQGADVGVELDQVAQEGMDLGRGEGFLAGRQEARDDLAKLGAPAGIDDAGGDEARGFRISDGVVRAIEEGVGVYRGNVAAHGELAAQLAEHARDLHGNALRLARILLDQAIRRLIEKAALLFDEEQVAGQTDDGKVDFAVDGVASVDAGPMHGVIDGVVVGQAIGEDGEGFNLALRSAGDGEFAPAVGDDSGHRGIS